MGFIRICVPGIRQKSFQNPFFITMFGFAVLKQAISCGIGFGKRDFIKKVD